MSAAIATDAGLLTGIELAKLLRVGKSTPGRWVKEGKLTEPDDFIRTPGGHLRYRAAVVTRLLNGAGWQRAEDEAASRLAAARTDLDTIAAGLLPAAAPLTEGEQ